MVALMLSVYVHGRAMQMCDIGCCVCMCSKAGDRCSERELEVRKTYKEASREG